MTYNAGGFGGGYTSGTFAPSRGEDGLYPTYAWPGGYPIFYFDTLGNILCADCANKPEDEYDGTIMASDINWEDTSLYCDDCGDRIESAYGDDDLYEEDGERDGPFEEQYENEQFETGGVFEANNDGDW